MLSVRHYFLVAVLLSALAPQNTCAKCPKDCFSCDFEDTPAVQCNSCSNGYGLTPQKTCAKCLPKDCYSCDSTDVPTGQCSECDEGYKLTPQKTCARDCSRFDCCTYDCPKAKAGTCSEEPGYFTKPKPIRTISWKTTAKRLTVTTCQAACLKDPSCFAYRFVGTQNCKGDRPCRQCPCKNFGEHEGDCHLYGADAKNEIVPQSLRSFFVTRAGGYCWH